jgi:5-methylthioadenosine/S-adenosylhomocysteine deaminase
MGILLQNALIITQNPNDDVFTGDILIERGVISQIGSNISSSGQEVYQLDDLVITPGFIQSHVHLCQTLFRNLSDDLELLEWLEKYVWPLEMSHDENSLRASTKLGLAELLLNGTTSILDMGNARYQEVIFQEMAASGIRGLSGMVMMDAGKQEYKQETSQVIAATTELIEKWHNSHNGRIQYALAPRFVLSCSQKLWEEVKKLSTKYNLIIHSHSSENQKEWQQVKELTGYSNLEYFVRNNLASSKLCLAHCIWVSEQEIQMLSDYQINVLHCPSANLKLASGVAPVPEFLEKGINVSLGSDGAACNNNLDIFNEMRLASFIQKLRLGATAISAKVVFDMATRGGAKSLSLNDQIGSIEEGKKADFVVMDLNKVHSIPADDIYAQIVYSSKASNVRHVMVDGKWVVYDQKLQNFSEKKIIENAGNQIQLLYAKQKSSSELSKEV